MAIPGSIGVTGAGMPVPAPVARPAVRQINDSPEALVNGPRETRSIHGFADLSLAHAHATPPGVWNDLEIRVVRQHYTLMRLEEITPKP